MTPTGNEIERLVQACSTGSLDRVKSMYDKHGESILGFKSGGVGDFKYPIYYAIRNGHMDVAKYLKSINPSNPKVCLSKLEIYNLFLEILSNRKGTKPGKKRRDQYHQKCIDFIYSGLELFDKETMVLAAVDATIKRLDIELYEMLIDELGVNPSVFQLRMSGDAHISLGQHHGFNIESPKYKTFTREIKLRSLLK